LKNQDLKSLLLNNDLAFWEVLAARSLEADRFEDLLFLSTLRKKAAVRGLARTGNHSRQLRLALIGGFSLYPLHELIEHLLATAGVTCELFIGDYDNYISEIMDENSDLYQFQPQVVFLIPSDQRCKYQGQLSDSREAQRAQVADVCSQILDMCRLVHKRTGAEVILGNFKLPVGFDLGPYRYRVLGSDWSFRKEVNLELGLNAPACVHICDIEFLEHRRGALTSQDDRAWFESKQPCSTEMLVQVAKEVVHIIDSLHRSPKKVLVLDLDNTLWGGIVGDDGLEGIEIGDTSPRGEAFKAFQKYVLSLTERGVLLAVCSKNEYDAAFEPFAKHPEMVLRPEHFVSFKANWDPKTDNIKQMSTELNLGLDSFVFVDDNPAEIEIVRQLAPEVTPLLLGPDPADYVRQLQDSRLFERLSITAEDSQRTGQYRQEVERKSLLSSTTDITSYLASLEMVGTFTEFNLLDAPRISQLINKSNQFNLTTRRRSEAEVHALIDDPKHLCFTMRLADRFGDHGLISVVIARLEKASAGSYLEIDTWLMSCRVLKRQVEEDVVNEIMRLARLHSCDGVRGTYLPSAKNSMVRELYSQLGFTLVSQSAERSDYQADVHSFKPFITQIQIARRTHESDRSNRSPSGSL
jgi:FkbH-like protein